MHVHIQKSLVLDTLPDVSNIVLISHSAILGSEQQVCSVGNFAKVFPAQGAHEKIQTFNVSRGISPKKVALGFRKNWKMNYK